MKIYYIEITIGPLVSNSVNCVVTYLTENTLKRKPVKLGKNTSKYFLVTHIFNSF